MVTEAQCTQEEEIWCTLAELFFLDTESTEGDFARVADLLKDNGWSRIQTEMTLLRLIAPNVAANLGWGLYPVIGEWAGFDRAWLSERIRRTKALRASRPKWFFTLSDWWSGRLLNRLGVENLLSRLQETSGDSTKSGSAHRD
jgi:hypothetical protein